MENILNKALSEVLTERWSEELRGVYGTDYKFSDGFELKMRDLIRKTDRPASRYIGYFAAAAAVVIAIGAAVIVPALVKSGIDTEEPEYTTTSAESAADTSVTASPTQTTAAVTSSSESSTAVTDITEQEDAEPEDAEPVSEPHDPDSVPSPEISADDIVGTSEQPDTAETGNDTDEVGEPENEMEIDDNDELVAEDEPDYDEAVDDADGESVVIDDVGYGNPMDVAEGDTLSELFARYFPDVSFDNLWTYSGFYYPEKKDRKYNYQLQTEWTEYAFINDFVHELGSAEYISDDSLYGDRNMTSGVSLSLYDIKRPIKHPNTFNNSGWTKYDYYYNFSSSKEAAPDYEDDIDEEDVVADEDVPIEEIYFEEERNMWVDLYVWRAPGDDSIGLVTLNLINYGSTIRGNVKDYGIEKDSRTFVIDGALTDKLFAGLDSMRLPENAETLGDISEKLNVTPDNISYSYVNVNYVYDTYLMFAKADNKYLSDLFTRYKDAPLTLCIAPWIEDTLYPSGYVISELYLDDSTRLDLYIDGEGHCFIGDGYIAYYFMYDDGELQKAVKSVFDANGYDAGMYGTLGEYLEGKNFTKLDSVELKAVVDGVSGKLTVTDKKELAEILAYLAGVFENAPYIIEPEEEDRPLRSSVYADLNVSRYRVPITVHDNDTVWMGGFDYNVFRLPKGTFKKFAEMVKNCGSAVFVPDDKSEEDEEELIVDDTVD